MTPERISFRAARHLGLSNADDDYYHLHCLKHKETNNNQCHKVMHYIYFFLLSLILCVLILLDGVMRLFCVWGAWAKSVYPIM